MKAAVQGRKECVTALLLAGADLTAVDPVRRKTAWEWAGLTGRFETIVQIRSILQRPRAEQFSDQYRPEWPALPELVAKALATKSRRKRLLEKICSTFSINLPHDPEADGVMDHMVRMTTCLASPFVATACQTICPGSPPEVGKQRLSVPEILKELELLRSPMLGPRRQLPGGWGVGRASGGWGFYIISITLASETFYFA
uniref:Uncharacterized protein n=1 Tax=Chrysemys picta bellii TaxID=8478 RepID=A0A8C3I2Z5_CHRPI